MSGFKEVVSIQKKGNAVTTAPAVSRAPRTTTVTRRVQGATAGLGTLGAPGAKLDRGHQGDDAEEHDRGRRGEAELVVAETLLVDVERHRGRRVDGATLGQDVGLVEELHPADQGRDGHEEDREAHQGKGDADDLLPVAGSVDRG